MTSHLRELDSPHSLLDKAIEVMVKDPHLLALILEGSLSRGDSDALSDVDLGLVYQASYRKRAWAHRSRALHQIGDVLCIADISDMVSWSCIVFYRHSRLHLTYYTIDEYLGEGTVLFDKLGVLKPINSKLSSSVTDTMSSPRFAFWFNRALIGAERADRMQVAESRLRLLEIWLGMVARARSSPFQGLRKADRYLTLDEMQWCDYYLEYLHSLHLIPLVSELVQRYLELLSTGAYSSPDISGARLIEAMLGELLRGT